MMGRNIRHTYRPDYDLGQCYDSAEDPRILKNVVRGCGMNKKYLK